MNNGKISLRQMKRLLFFDVLGLGLVAFPDLLAASAGTAGVLALLIGGALFIVYLCLLTVATRKGKKGSNWLLGVYGLYLLLASGYGLFLLGDLIKRFLLPDKSFGLIILLILLLVIYGKNGGLEGRARVYEVLFWPLIALLVFLFVLGLPGTEPQNLWPISFGGMRFWRGCYLAFLVCSVGQIAFFLPEYMEEGVTPARLRKGAVQALLLGILFLGAIYELLLGSFGTDALMGSRTPVMIYTSNIVVPGGFLRRQEALIAGVCFVALMAFIGSGFSYGTLCLKEIKRSKWMSLVAVVVLFAAAWMEYQNSAGGGVLGKWLLWISPIALCIPFLLTLGKKPQRSVALVLTLVLALTTTGCSVKELENRSFPMVLSLSGNDAGCELRYQYMDLSRVSDKKKAGKGSNQLSVESSSVSAALYEMDMKSGKVIDLNHLKVLLLEESFLEQPALMQELVEKGNGGIELPGNMLVFATKDIKAIEKLQESMDEDLGSYLEELMEGNPNYKKSGGTAFKNLICDWYNPNGNTILPRLGVKDQMPVVNGYFLIQSQRLGSDYRISKISEEDGLIANLCDGEANALDIVVDEGRIHLENVKVSYEYSRSNAYILCNLNISGDILSSESTVAEGGFVTDKDATDEAFCRRRAGSFFQGNIQNLWSEHNIDLTNSYYHLKCHDRDLWEQYKDDYPAYCDDLQLTITTNFDFVE